MKKQVYAFLLALCLIINMMSGVAMAEGEDKYAGHNTVRVTITESTCTVQGTWGLFCEDEDCQYYVKKENREALETGYLELAPHTPCLDQSCPQDKIAATCTEKGHNWIHCKNVGCGKLLVKDGETWVICTGDHENETCENCFIPAHGHSYTTFDAEDPTCTEPGHNAYKICTRVTGKDAEGEDIICGAYESGHEKVEIPAKGHSESKSVNGVIECDPTKSDDDSIDSSVEYVCPDCNTVVETAVDVRAPHTWKNVEAVESTCTENGNIAYRYCEVCDRMENEAGEVVTEEDVVTAKKEHDYQYYGAQAGSCTQDGARAGWKCSVCGAAHPDKPYPEAIDAPGHTYVKMNGQKATCTEDGYTAYEKCSVCGDEKGKTVIPATDHTWKMVIGTPATCTTDGIGAHEACSVCGEKEEGYEQYIIPAHGHSNEDGYYPEQVKYESEILINVADFYKKAGQVRLYKNDNVNAYHVIAEELCEYDEKGNLITDDKRKAATCTETGWDSNYYCSFCGEVLVEETVIPALGHDWLLTTPGTLPTCTEPGVSDYWTCQRKGCDEDMGGDEIVATGHSMVDVELTLPTCEEDGNFAYSYCTVCDTAVLKGGYMGYNNWVLYEDDRIDYEQVYLFETDVTVMPEDGSHPELFVIDAYNHKHTEPLVAKEATCTENGLEDGATRCLLCGKLDNVKLIKALGHELKTVAGYDATCTEDGLKAYVYCDRCGKAAAGAVDEKNKEESIAALKELLTASEITMPEEGDPADFVIGALGHVEKDGVAKDATCTDKGHTAGKYCERCKLTLEGYEEIPALGHDFSEIDKAGYAATCTEDGMFDLLGCSRCDATKYDCDHDEGKTEDDKLCEGTCNGVIPATGHTVSKLTPAKAATCTEYGFGVGAHCVACELNYEAIVDYLTNNETKITIEDLYEDGWVKVPVLYAPLGHEMAEVDAVAAKCETDGLKAYSYCLNCNHAVEGEIVEEPEDEESEEYAEWVEWYDSITASTISGPVEVEDEDEDGNEITVTVHADEFIIAATNHKNSISVGGAAFAATCTKAGSDGLAQCLDCGKVFEKSTPALGHDWVVVDAVKATCKDAGVYAHEDCSRCDALRMANGKTDEEGNFIPDGTYKTITAAETVEPKHEKHDDLQHVDAVMATCKEAGHSEGQECSVCLWNNFTVLEPNADEYHKYLEENKDALIADGTLAWVDTVVGDGTPGSGMQAVKCPECDNYVVDVRLWPEVQMGDVNMDGFVDALDALMVLQYEVGVLKELPNEIAADCFVDEYIDTLDALWILNASVN